MYLYSFPKQKKLFFCFPLFLSLSLSIYLQKFSHNALELDARRGPTLRRREHFAIRCRAS